MFQTDIFKDLIGRRDFLSKDEIIQFVKNSNEFDPNTEDLDKTTTLKIFQTSKQQTWLVSSKERLYNILDDNREEQPIINWSVPKQDLIKKHEGIIDITIRDYKEKTGLVNIGPYHKNWLYTKKLFDEVDIKTSIIQVICSFFLKTTSWYMKERQEEYLKIYPQVRGTKIYNIKACIDSDVPGALEIVDRVEYHLHPTYKKRIQIKADYKDKFLLKELAYGGYTLIAKVFLKGKEEPIELQHLVKLQDRGPHIC